MALRVARCNCASYRLSRSAFQTNVLDRATAQQPHSAIAKAFLSSLLRKQLHTGTTLPTEDFSGKLSAFLTSTLQNVKKKTIHIGLSRTYKFYAVRANHLNDFATSKDTYIQQREFLEVLYHLLSQF